MKQEDYRIEEYRGLFQIYRQDSEKPLNEYGEVGFSVKRYVSLEEAADAIDHWVSCAGRVSYVYTENKWKKDSK